MESGPVCRSGNRPRMLMCYLCGREYGSKSLNIHIPQCQRKWLMEEEKKPKNERRPLPPQPNAEKALGNGGARAYDSFNVEAFAAFEQTLEQCPYCQRRFLPKPFMTHQKACTAAHPAKPAGTGLIKYSLTNRLVPGAVAGSMHGKAKKPPLPLHLCRPPPKLKPKLKSTQRPAWTGAGESAFDEMEDHQLPIVRHKHKPSAQEWCLQAETNFSPKRGRSLHKTKLPDSRNSFENRKGTVESFGGDNAHLVSTFGDKWKTHRGDMDLPKPQKNNGAKEWFVPAAETSSASAKPRTVVKTNNAFNSHKTIHRQPTSTAVRSSQCFPERTLDFVKTLPPSKAPQSRAFATFVHRETGGDLRHHRRSPRFY